MGREIRRVPPNWQHPTCERPDYRTRQMVERYQPMYERDFAEAMHEWYQGWCKWEAGERPDYAEPDEKYWDGSGRPPDPAYYSHGFTKERCTWYQLFETVSEGTPVSPPFATQQELADYLANNGDFWDQQRAREGRMDGPAKWGQEAANRFVFGAGWAPSGMLVNGVMHSARDMPSEVKQEGQVDE